MIVVAEPPRAIAVEPTVTELLAELTVWNGASAELTCAVVVSSPDPEATLSDPKRTTVPPASGNTIAYQLSDQ